MQARSAIVIRALLVSGAVACDSEPAAKGRAAQAPPAAPAARGPVAGVPQTGTVATVGAAPVAVGGMPEVRLRVAQSAEHGAYLTDAAGRAVYLLESDERGSTCYDRCMGIWPPVFAGQALPSAADPAIAPRPIGSRRRRDGLLQVTYDGHPLYYYSGDGGPGRTLGQHVEDAWGEWYLVSPSGREVDDRRRGRTEGGRRR